VIAVSFGAYIYGTTIVFPAVANPSLKQSNKTYWSSNSTYSKVSSSELSLSNNCSSCHNSSILSDAAELSPMVNSTDAYLPFLITDFDLSLVGNKGSFQK
jgi:hypothetical protein